MLTISLKSFSGYSDVGVITKQTNSNPELGWVSEDVTPTRTRRNVCMFPFRLENPVGDNTTYVGPDVANNPSLFVTSEVFFGAILKDSVLVTVMDEFDNVVRSHFCTPVFNGLVKNGKVQINPGDVIFTQANMAFFDKTEIANSIPPSGRIYYIQFEFNPLNTIPGAYCNLVVPGRFGTSQLHHSGDVDIL